DRAWRWVDEMEQISATFAHANMPSGFHEAAADIYRRLAKFKDEPTSNTEAVIEALKAPARRA
ncbi:MAG TPA: DUF1932 domain-containing protein, partial [Gammaproteobacteria bacterium]|nr:DUF1932 domain-containing protein [Gammaproteobacteria bacterium]